ncbi:MAG TPA: hypothetical protein VJZ72_07315 [Candidatus Limnocylindrales bacterium]|nr:hypothetical protein [Candidatus Limnocylindrales bacterium]
MIHPADAAAVRMAMTPSGHQSIPFLGFEYLIEGLVVDEGADRGKNYLDLVGAAGAGSYASTPSVAPPKAAFVDAYRAAYGADPNKFATAAPACTEVILQSLESVGRTGPSAEDLREAVRAYAVNPDHRYDTVLGSIGFDANGDSTQQFIQINRAEPSTAGDAGTWVPVKEQDYGPAP